MLWQQLRDRKFQNLRFRRQYPYRNFVIDFYCAEHHLALEIDGAIHNDPKQRAHDIDRQLVLESEGIHFIRVSASDVAGQRASRTNK